MSDENRQAASAGPPLRRARKQLPDHPLRVALLDLLAEVGTVTSTQAAERLGHSSGLCSFHLRQLARHGLIEEVPRQGGRARPWRLRWESGHSSQQGASEEFDTLARGLEDESYQHWLGHRDQAPAEWRHDESFSAVVHLTPAEMTELAASVRQLLAPYRDRDQRPAARPAGAMPVAAIARLFPLLPENPAQPPTDPRDDSGRGTEG
ncbi:helix-turn-helix domain-containing protein [Streptomyces aureocirculatus]|uniref:helix-turn-helix domain-containing protein n=1 Tax=Streptomyces aureocirculatus TaxID=67275 RepID=UPI00068C9D04|nr:helix-turn-helix domain-containing protein [Streptomyces aureocirculatus]